MDHGMILIKDEDFCASNIFVDECALQIIIIIIIVVVVVVVIIIIIIIIIC